MDYRNLPEMDEIPPYLMAGLMATARCGRLDLSQEFADSLNKSLKEFDIPFEVRRKPQGPKPRQARAKRKVA